MTARLAPCNACGATGLESLGPVGLRPMSVRSDSLPCSLPSVIRRCGSCGHFQKVLTEAERAEVERIYATYEPHHLSGGREQLVFPSGQRARPRTYHCLEQCLAILPEDGHLLDVGTGNGPVLKSAHALLPQWSLYGFDVGDRYRTEVESINGVKGFWFGDFGLIPDRAFDLVVLWQTLEHVPEPATFLAQVESKLAPGGRILMQVPDVLRNPFDLAVIDHESHFGAAQLMHVCRRAGLRVALEGHAWIHNCLTLLLVPGDPGPEAALDDDPEWVFPWVHHALTTISEGIGDDSFAIFGTGMAGIWMAGQFGRAPEFFIDEDEARAGQEIAGAPIVTPAQVDAVIPIVMSFPKAAATAIARRLVAAYPALSANRFVIAPPPPVPALR